MKERFEGDNRPQLIAALVRQEFCFGSQELASELADAGSLVEFQKGDILIDEGGEDTDMYFLIAGNTAVIIKGNHMSDRGAGQHVGDISAIEPSLRRAATVVAHETVVALKVSSATILKLGEKFPNVWPAIARVLARRLHQRNDHIPAPHTSPKIFIISSAEALDVAREVAALLERDVYAKVWEAGVFFAGGYVLDDLEREVDECDFAVAVCEPDDIIESRGSRAPTIRDNVIFELGLFMGKLTRTRSFLLHPRIANLKLPSDLSGLTRLGYEPTKDPKELATRLGPACNEIRKSIKSLGVRKIYG
ncbi:MAG TPA: TIR domain-containing protein [Devosia sp.]|jgi:predicted nucleotide-binding protein|uniref:TIR domain-containing protein n=1 Tax=Devosia sp. TaxID=1871048 RepID=UPI002DDD1D98|nr:TIR domain-containing protein [Devosia sp.]HEV2517192.1 TIR domain-containing protein [Devosia sp.]